MAGAVCSKQGVGADVAPQGEARRVSATRGSRETFTGGTFPGGAQLGRAAPGLRFAAQLGAGCAPVRSWPMENSSVSR